MSLGDPNIYTDEQIELMLAGDRRDVDRLLIKGLNTLAAAFLTFRDSEFRPHIEEEQLMIEALGTPDEVKRRRIWLDLQIKREQVRHKLRTRILESSVLWALPIVLTFFLLVFSDGLRYRFVEWLSLSHNSQGHVK